MLRPSGWKRAAIGAAIAALAAAGVTTVTATTASAEARDGVCDANEFCYFYNSDHQGSISDFTGSLADYGATQPSCYDFKGEGAGKGECVKNNAASVWNRTGGTVRVYFNSDYGGATQDFAAGAKTNLNLAATSPHPARATDDDDEEEAVPLVDVPLEEAKHILLDYLSLRSAKAPGVAQAQMLRDREAATTTTR